MKELIVAFVAENYFAMIFIGVVLLYFYTTAFYRNYCKSHSGNYFQIDREKTRQQMSYSFLFGVIACLVWPLSYTAVILLLIGKLIVNTVDFLLRKTSGE